MQTKCNWILSDLEGGKREPFKTGLDSIFGILGQTSISLFSIHIFESRKKTTWLSLSDTETEQTYR